MAREITFTASFEIFIEVMEWMKWTKNEHSLRMPWTELKPIGIDTMSIPEKFSGGSIETNLEQAFGQLLCLGWLKIDLVWWRGMWTNIFSNLEVPNDPLVYEINEMNKNKLFLEIAWNELKSIRIDWYWY